MNLQEFCVQPFKYDKVYSMSYVHFIYIISAELKWMEPEEAKEELEKCIEKDLLEKKNDYIILNIEKDLFDKYEEKPEEDLVLEDFDKKFEEEEDIFGEIVNKTILNHKVEDKTVISEINKIQINQDLENINKAAKKFWDEKITKKNIIGIDEAGKGPVLGSMFVGGVSHKTDNISINVKDSKDLTDNQREKLYSKIKNKNKFKIDSIEITTKEIDNKNINRILERKHSEIINNLIDENCINIVYIDSVIDNEKKYSRILKRKINTKDIVVICENKADSKYDIVSSASIVAKQKRENHIEILDNNYDKNIGSGYPSDKYTREFIKEYYKENGKLPNCVRESWNTCNKIINSID